MYLSVVTETSEADMEIMLPRVLYFDTDVSNHAFMCDSLQNEYEVSTAVNTSDALTQLEETVFDIVLLDTAYDGLDFLRTLRSRSEFDSMTVILVGYAHDFMPIRIGLSLGAKDYLTHPIQPLELQVRLRTQWELQQAQRKSRAAESELDRVKAFQIKLLRMARHDVRHPITNIRMLETMLRHVAKDKDQYEIVELLDSMNASLDSLEDIIQDFSNATETTELQVNIEPISVNRVLYNLALRYQMMATAKSIDLNIDSNEISVWADNQYLSQAIENLLSNALKYSPNNTTISVNNYQASGWVYIMIKDEGPGIPIEEWDQLFTALGSLSTQPTGNETSTGLGLWIVKQLVDAMGGKVGVEFPVEGGSVFWVALPAA